MSHESICSVCSRLTGFGDEDRFEQPVNLAQIRWRDPDGTPRSETRASAKTRDELLVQVRECEDRRLRYEPQRESAAPPAIGDGVTAFVADLARSRSPATVRQYRLAGSMFLRFVVESHPTATVADWSREMLADFYAHLDEGGRATDTKRRIVEKLESCWRWLFDTEWHPSVPRPKTIEVRECLDCDGSGLAPAGEHPRNGCPFCRGTGAVRVRVRP